MNYGKNTSMKTVEVRRYFYILGSIPLFRIETAPSLPTMIWSSIRTPKVERNVIIRLVVRTSVSDGSHEPFG